MLFRIVILHSEKDRFGLKKRIIVTVLETVIDNLSGVAPSPPTCVRTVGTLVDHLWLHYTTFTSVLPKPSSERDSPQIYSAPG